MENLFKFQDIVGKEGFFIGKNIEVLQTEPFDDVSFNKGMRGKIVSINPREEKYSEDSYVDIVIDFSPFENYNIPVMDICFYNYEGIPVLTWYETDFYKKSKGTDNVFRLINDKTGGNSDNGLFKLLDDEQVGLYEQFQKSEDESYTIFLENLILKAKV